MLTGWLLDIYAAPAVPAASAAPVAPATPAPENSPPASSPTPPAGAVAWLLGDDGQRHRLELPFPVSFYAAGPAARLHDLWRFLRKGPNRVRLERQERRELFTPQPLTVLAITLDTPALMNDLFRNVSHTFPDLTYFDADIALPLHGAARWGIFPLARCRVAPGSQPGDPPTALEALNTPWELEPPAPPLRILTLAPDSDPNHAAPRRLLVQVGLNASQTYRLPLEPIRPLLINLAAILNRHDPDLLLTSWGDSWLLPLLLEQSEKLGLPLPLNRDAACPVGHHKELSYFSYGQVVHRDRQVHLSGRWHIDRRNAMLWDDYTLEGILESARVTSLPVQTAARVSPGTGISSMQIVTALRLGILVPWRKAEPERFKSAADLFAVDQGGLVYQPLVGLHRDVGAIDFVSMYPGIMVRFNISPETAGAGPLRARELLPFPPAPIAAGNEQSGLVPQTLAPLLQKRLDLKGCLANLPRWDPRRGPYKARASAHKWLLVTCFGYLGYRNARFGRIEAHEAVTSYGREALLRAKETAEDLGFTVLHMYVDGLWVQRPDATSVPDFQALLEAVTERTNLPIALDGIYRWVAFLHSRVDNLVPVANRYFGVFQDGSLKVRGIEARRRDTPPFIAQTQMEMLEILAQAPDVDHLPEMLPRAAAHLRGRVDELQRGKVSFEDLLTGLRLSRELERYRVLSPAARAARQLIEIGKQPRPGQRIRLLYLRGEPGVHAWDLPDLPDPRSLDIPLYTKLLLRAAESVFEPFGGMKWFEPERQTSFLSPKNNRAPEKQVLQPHTKILPAPLAARA